MIVSNGIVSCVIESGDGFTLSTNCDLFFSRRTVNTDAEAIFKSMAHFQALTHL